MIKSTLISAGILFLAFTLPPAEAKRHRHKPTPPPTLTPKPTPTPSPTPRPTATPTATPTASPTSSPIPTATPSPTQSPAAEVWLAIRTVPGSGTQSDPYDASGTKYDERMAAISQNTTIHLGAGTFETHVDDPNHVGAAFQVKSGWRIVGAGIDQTVIRMVASNMSGRHFDHEAFKNFGAVNNVTLSDLTIDCNSTNIITSADIANGERYVVIFGVNVSGTNNMVERVRVTNQYGTFANGGESFGIRLGGTTNATIRYCVADSPHGTYGGAPFSFFGGSAQAPLRNAQGYGNKATGVNDGKWTNTFNTGGFNVAFVEGMNLHDNEFTDCCGILYCDTGTTKSVKVSNNKVTRGWMSIGLVATADPTWGSDDTQITGNALNIQNRGGENSAIKISNNFNSNTVVAGNTISYDPSGSGVGFHALLCYNQKTISACNNKIDTASAGAQSQDALVTGTNLCFSANRTTTGGIVKGLEDTPACVGAMPPPCAPSPIQISLSWDKSPDPKAIGYKLWYGTTSKVYTKSIDVGNVTTATLNAAPAPKYFIAASAYSASGGQSRKSNEITYP